MSLYAGLELLRNTEYFRRLNSPIIRLEVLGVNLIILNSMEVIADLLDKRSAIYSDRYVYQLGSHGRFANSNLV